MIKFSEPNDENIIKVLFVYDGDFAIIGEIYQYGNRWASMPDYLIEDALEELKDRIRRTYSHL